MGRNPTPEEEAFRKQRLAGQANDRAWSLTERGTRTAEEDQEMLHAAHAAMYFWSRVGDDKNKAHAAQLLAHVYASLKLPEPAARYLAQSEPLFLSDSAEAWERALAHAVASNVAAARGDEERQREHYRRAVEQVAELPDPEERFLLEATLHVLPVPRP